MRVLLIDDNKDINDMICMCLEGQDISCRIIEEGRFGIRIILGNLVF